MLTFYSCYILRYLFSLLLSLSQLQQLILTGELACKREEAATLAAIQMHVEEAWPDDNDDAFATDQFGGDARECEHLLTGSMRMSERGGRKELHTLHR